MTLILKKKYKSEAFRQVLELRSVFLMLFLNRLVDANEIEHKKG